MASTPGDSCVPVEDAFPSTDRPLDVLFVLDDADLSNSKAVCGFITILGAIGKLGGRGAGRCATRVEIRCACFSRLILSLLAASAKSIVEILLSGFCMLSSLLRIGFEIAIFPILVLGFAMMFTRSSVPFCILLVFSFSGKGGPVGRAGAKFDGFNVEENCSWVRFPFIPESAITGLEIAGNVPSSFRLMVRLTSVFVANADTDILLTPFRSS
jgi:hypothetical protein